MTNRQELQNTGVKTMTNEQPAPFETWQVIPDPVDLEMYAVMGSYLVARNLPIEDACLIAAAQNLLKASEQAVRAIESYKGQMTNEIAAKLADAKWSLQAAIAEATTTK